MTPDTFTSSNEPPSSTLWGGAAFASTTNTTTAKPPQLNWFNVPTTTIQPRPPPYHHNSYNDYYHGGGGRVYHGQLYQPWFDPYAPGSITTPPQAGNTLPSTPSPGQARVTLPSPPHNNNSTDTSHHAGYRASIQQHQPHTPTPAHVLPPLDIPAASSSTHTAATRSRKHTRESNPQGLSRRAAKESDGEQPTIASSSKDSAEPHLQTSRHAAPIDISESSRTGLSSSNDADQQQHPPSSSAAAKHSSEGTTRPSTSNTVGNSSQQPPSTSTTSNELRSRSPEGAISGHSIHNTSYVAHNYDPSLAYTHGMLPLGTTTRQQQGLGFTLSLRDDPAQHYPPYITLPAYSNAPHDQHQHLFTHAHNAHHSVERNVHHTNAFTTPPRSHAALRNGDPGQYIITPESSTTGKARIITPESSSPDQSRGLYAHPMAHEPRHMPVADSRDIPDVLYPTPQPPSTSVTPLPGIMEF